LEVQIKMVVFLSGDWAQGMGVMELGLSEGVVEMGMERLRSLAEKW
jgi:hypothetical protein